MWLCRRCIDELFWLAKGYLEQSLFLRYVNGHIWSCPPSEGDDYIFHCHPPEQKIPKHKRLVEWYKKMLDKAIEDGVVYEYKVFILSSISL